MFFSNGPDTLRLQLVPLLAHYQHATVANVDALTSVGEQAVAGVQFANAIGTQQKEIGPTGQNAALQIANPSKQPPRIRWL